MPDGGLGVSSLFTIACVPEDYAVANLRNMFYIQLQ